MQQPGHSVTDWAVALVTNARILHTPPCEQYLDAFLACVPEYTGIAATVKTCVPALLAEGLLQNFQQKSPEVYQAGRMHSMYVVTRCLWRVGLNGFEQNEWKINIGSDRRRQWDWDIVAIEVDVAE